MKPEEKEVSETERITEALARFPPTMPIVIDENAVEDILGVSKVNVRVLRSFQQQRSYKDRLSVLGMGRYEKCVHREVASAKPY